MWTRMEQLLTNGSKWPLEEISESNKVANLMEALQFGNHKEVAPKPELLVKLISDDIHYSYELVIPCDKISRLPNACLAPMNIMKQFTFDVGGEIDDKEHLTHDQSLKWQSGTSINSRVIREELQCCMYGHCLM
jgi:hypothetical protein